ncbi:fatty acid amide hydrolase-like protein [Tanacetum coccineum]
MWDNCRRGTSNVKKRLYRFMATPSWAAMYPLHYCRNLPRVASDHYPVVLADDFLRVVKNAWAHGLLMGLGADPTSLLVACVFFPLILNRKGTRLPLDSRINFALFNSFTAADYFAAQRLRRRIMYYHTKIFKNVDVIVTPTTGYASLVYPCVEFCKSEMKVQCSHNSRICELALPASKRPKQQDVPKRARLRESVRQR